MSEQRYYPILRLIFMGLSVSLGLIITHVIPLPISQVQWLGMALVATIGLSHGSLDWLLSAHWGLRNSRWQSLWFFLGYTLLVGVTLIGWWLWPTAAFSIFLLMSVVHFGHDWQDELNSGCAYIVGLAVVSLPAVTFQPEVKLLFNLLLPGEPAQRAALALHMLGFFSLSATVIIAAICLYHSSKRWVGAEIVTLLLTGLFLPPLLYFSLYFCALHAAKHGLKMGAIGLYQQQPHLIWNIVWPTALCLLAGLIACCILTQESFSEDAIRCIFIGLAALTVPHYVLVEVYPRYGEFSM